MRRYRTARGCWRLTGSARLVIFPNGYKQKETDPDYIAYIVPAERRDDHRAGSDDFGGDERKVVNDERTERHHTAAQKVVVPPPAQCKRA